MTTLPKVGIVDYGMGNLWSLTSALTHVGAHVVLVDRPDDLPHFSHLVLPGVGSFRRASERLAESGLGDAIVDRVNHGGSVLLGICLGMQLMGVGSPEDGWSPGLNLVPVTTERFHDEEVERRRIPHIGFASTRFPQGNEGLFAGLRETTDFYFVHSYRMLPEGDLGATAVCDYGVSYLAGFDRGNVCATQFHPEKSQQQGLHLLRNFVDRKP